MNKKDITRTVKDLKQRAVGILKKLEKLTKTDMVYLAKGSFWMSVGKVAQTLVSLATLAAFANWLSVESYGTYQFILSVVGIVGIASLPGIKTSLTRSVAQGNEGALAQAFKAKMFWSLTGVTALLVLSGWYYINGDMILSGAFLIVALVYPIKNSSSLFLSLWQGRGRFDILALYRIISDIAIAVLVIATLYLTDNLYLIVAAFFGGTALFYGLSLLITSFQTTNNHRDDEVVKFGQHLTVMGAIGRVADHIDTLILWSILGPAQVAIYALALRPVEKAQGFMPIQALALPKLSKNGVKGIKRKKAIFRKFLLLFTITVPAAAVLALLAPWLYKFLFPQYTDSVIYFQALTVLLALKPTVLISSSLIAEAKTRFLYITQLSIPTIKIALFILLIPIWGIWGLVLALIVSKLINTGLSLYFFWRM